MMYFLVGYLLLEPDTSFKDKKKRYVINFEFQTILPGPWAISWTNPSPGEIQSIRKKYHLSEIEFNNLQKSTDNLFNTSKLFDVRLLNYLFFRNRDDALHLLNEYFKKSKTINARLIGLYLPEDSYQKISHEIDADLFGEINRKTEMPPDEKIIGYDVINIVEFGKNLRLDYSYAVRRVIDENEYGLLKSLSDAFDVIKTTDYALIHKSVVMQSGNEVIQVGDDNVDHWIPWAFTEIKV
ncbi:MAG: hypothetical protein JXD23_17115 [Spirochaetales bacterium]|nr:hypothetical protein [Spirochaetales bacterium]